jgi:hypothetical protein
MRDRAGLHLLRERACIFEARGIGEYRVGVFASEIDARIRRTGLENHRLALRRAADVQWSRDLEEATFVVQRVQLFFDEETTGLAIPNNRVLVSILRYAKLAGTSATTNAASIGSAAVLEASIVTNELPKCCDVHRHSLEPAPNQATMVQDTGAREISPRQSIPGCLDLGRRNWPIVQADLSLPTRSRIAEMPQPTKSRVTWYTSHAHLELSSPDFPQAEAWGFFAHNLPNTDTPTSSFLTIAERASTPGVYLLCDEST